MATKKDAAAVDAALINAAPKTATPENTPVPGGGSWRWDAALPGWVPNTPAQPLQPGDTGALQTPTAPTTQE